MLQGADVNVPLLCLLYAIVIMDLTMTVSIVVHTNTWYPLFGVSLDDHGCLAHQHI